MFLHRTNTMYFTENGFCFALWYFFQFRRSFFLLRIKPLFAPDRSSVLPGQSLRFARTEPPFRPDRASVSLMNRFGFSRRETFTLCSTAVASSGRTAVAERVATESSPKQEAVWTCIRVVGLCIAGQSSPNREAQRMRHRRQIAASPWLPVWQANVFLLRFAK
ncbi:Uncharacterised protein [Bacteroides pyogenes]|nr:Uncharacterised protein [Bacteroides pyogenes]